MRNKDPSPAAVTALELVRELQDQVRFLRTELRSTRRLALASFGVATAAIGVMGANVL